jgi:hypothetical protein
LTPKWNPILVQEDLGVTEVFEDGRMMPGLNIAAQDEDVDQVRTGYRCIRCWEPQETAWPRSCFLCGFPIGKHQAEHFARAYKGYDPSARTGADLNKAADEMAERGERRAFEHRTGISVVVGKSLKKVFKG